MADWGRAFEGLVGGIGDFANLAGGMAMKSMFEQEAQRQAIELKEGVDIRGREQAHGMAKELEGTRQTFEATQNEARNKTSIQVAGISAAAQVQTTQMNITAMSDLRKAEAAKARSETERIDLGIGEAKQLNTARDTMIAVQNNPNSTAAEIETANRNYYLRDTTGALQIQQTASARIKAEGDQLKLEVDKKADNALREMEKAQAAGNQEDFKKWQAEHELYNPLAKQNRVNTENATVEGRKKLADTVIEENILKAREAAANAASPEERRKAEELLRIWTQTPKDEMTNVALWQAQAKAAEVSANHVASEILKMQRDNIDDPERMRDLLRLRNQYIAEQWDTSEKAKIMLYRMAGLAPPEAPKVAPETFNIDPVTGKGTPTPAGASGTYDPKNPTKPPVKGPRPAPTTGTIPEPPASLLDWSRAQ